MSKRTLLVTLCVGLGLRQVSAQRLDLTRPQVYEALRSSKILNPDRMLVHYSHTCSLNLEGALYPVVDIEELVKGSATPRGFNRIIIFSPTLKVVREFDYVRQRPLFCQGNRLYVYGDITVGNTLPEGNVLSFEDHAKNVKISHVEPNDYPVPATRSRTETPQ